MLHAQCFLLVHRSDKLFHYPRLQSLLPIASPYQTPLGPHTHTHIHMHARTPMHEHTQVSLMPFTHYGLDRGARRCWVMVAQVADVRACLCVWMCQGYLLQLQALLIGNLLILVRYHLCHFICLAWSVCVCVSECVCVCVGGGMGAGEHVIADVIGIGWKSCSLEQQGCICKSWVVF